jgi:hypothetical protein
MNLLSGRINETDFPTRETVQDLLHVMVSPSLVGGCKSTIWVSMDDIECFAF